MIRRGKVTATAVAAVAGAGAEQHGQHNHLHQICYRTSDATSNAYITRVAYFIYHSAPHLHRGANANVTAIC